MTKRTWLAGWGASVAAALTLTLTLTSAVAPAMAAPGGPGEEPLKISVISDPHVFLTDMIGDTADYQTALATDRKMLTESEPIMEAAIDALIQEAPDVLIIAGDLTRDGELRGNQFVAEKLSEVKQALPETEIVVTPGNHDINNSNARDFNTGGASVPAEKTSPEQFDEIYSVVYDDPSIIEHYEADEGLSGERSFVTRPAPGYTLITIDSARYSADNTDSGLDEHETGGQLSADLEQWVVEKAQEAEERGDVVLATAHHGFVKHFSMQDTILAPYLVNDFERLGPALADAGVDYLFTGHMHANDIAELTTDAGNRLVDIETGSLVTYPTPYRNVELTREHDGDENVTTMRAETVFGLSVPSFTDPLTGEEHPAIDDLTAFAKDHPNNQLNASIIQGLAAAEIVKIGEDMAAAGGIRPYLEIAVPELLGVDFQTALDETIVPAVREALAGLGDSAVSAVLDIDAEAAPMLTDAILDVLEEALTPGGGSSAAVEIVAPLLDAVLHTTLTSSGETFVDLANYAYQTHLRGDEDSMTEPAWVTEGKQSVADGTALDAIVDVALDELVVAVYELAELLPTSAFSNVAGLGAGNALVAADPEQPMLLGFAGLGGMLLPSALFESTANAEGIRPWKENLSTVRGLLDWLAEEGVLGITVDFRETLRDGLEEMVVGTDEAPGMLTEELRNEVNGLLSALLTSMTTDENGTPDAEAVYETRERLVVEEIGSVTDVTSTRGTTPALPATVPVAFTDGTTGERAVTWADAPDGSTVGEFTVAGSVEGTDLTASVRVVITTGSGQPGDGEPGEDRQEDPADGSPATDGEPSADGGFLATTGGQLAIGAGVLGALLLAAGAAFALRARDRRA